MSLKTMIETVVRAERERDAALKEVGKNAATEIAAMIAEKLPAGWAFQCEGWAPHFNDGDPCVFNMRYPCVYDVANARDEDGESIDDRGYLCRVSADHGWTHAVDLDYGIDSYDAEVKVGNTRVYRADPIPGLTREALLAVADVYIGIPEAIMKRAFGSSFRIRVLSDGSLRTEEPSHD